MHHYHLGRGINEDHLAADAAQHEPALGAWQQPDLVAIAEVPRGRTRREVRVGWRHGRRVDSFDLAPLYRSTVGLDRMFSMVDQFAGVEDPVSTIRPIIRCRLSAL